LLLADIRHIRINVKDHNIDRERRLFFFNKFLPQIFIGDSSSRKTGWSKNISLDLLHRNFISFSCNCTNLLGLKLLSFFIYFLFNLRSC